MSILVTGCAGFIGSRVCALLMEQGHEVHGWDVLDAPGDMGQRRRRLVRLGGRHPYRFQFDRVDIRDRVAVAGSWPDTVSAVIHLAARAGVRESVDHPDDYWATNLTGTDHVLGLCVDRGVDKLVFSSTSSVYGNGPTPSREDQPLDPRSPYAESKLQAELACRRAHDRHGLDVSILRYFSVYGPDGRTDMCIPRFIESLCTGQPVLLNGDGRQQRDFTFIDDIAAGTVAALRPLGCQAVNLGAGRAISIRAVLRLLEQLLRRRVDVVRHSRNPADAVRTGADVSQAADLLGWLPRTGFVDGLRQTVECSLAGQGVSAACAKKRPRPLRRAGSRRRR